MTHAVIGNRSCSVTLAWDSGMPVVESWGRAGAESPSLLQRPTPHGTLDKPITIGLIAEEASGFAGRPGIVGHRQDGTAWSPSFQLDGEPLLTVSTAVFSLADSVAGLALALTVNCHDSGVVVVDATLTNTGTTPYFLSRLAPSLPISQGATELLEFEGRWCLEYQTSRKPFAGLTLVENRRGRTSHDRAPTLIAGTAGFGEQHGEVWAASLAWSGNFSMCAQTLLDGQRHLQAAELLLPGEICLKPGEQYLAPQVVASYSDSGLSSMSQSYHHWLRSQAHWPDASAPRPVTLNTWEAVYFNHDFETLTALADTAAAIGVERFVLDDGWFGSRRDDTSGLGDWFVSDDAWPDGLEPLAEHLRGLGLQFGLWFEPEMVNPDSDLYRAHPDWTLTTDGYDPVLGRNQLVLDLGREEVRAYLLERISDIVTTCDVSYIKWDMNRDVVQGSGANGRAGVHNHVLGLYQLLDDLRLRHQGLEIESCSSGGARIDLGILSHTVRVWASDSNDAVDRQQIQRGISMIYPPEAMGSHIGPPTAHTTRRTQALGFRAATAFFGHFGIEWNILKCSLKELAQLKEWIELHKAFRPLLHGGTVVRVDHPAESMLVNGVVASDQSRAIFSLNQVVSERRSLQTPVRLAGLDPNRVYQLRVIETPGPRVGVGRSAPNWLTQTTAVSGAELQQIGLQPPVMAAESSLLLELSS